MIIVGVEMLIASLWFLLRGLRKDNKLLVGIGCVVATIGGIIAGFGQVL